MICPGCGFPTVLRSCPRPACPAAVAEYYRVELLPALPEQAARLFRILGDAGRTFTCGPTSSGWFARVDDGPTFRGSSLVDSLAQLATTLALDAES